MNAPCIIIGGSHAASQLSINVRQQGWTGRIMVISKESSLPYQHPPLSKSFLSEDKLVEDILLKPAEIYTKANIEFRLNVEVNNIDRERMEVTLNTGETLSYNKLALCTGASAIKIPLSDGNLTGVHYLRNVNDAIKIKKGIKAKKNAVIIGGGFIGLETAAVLKQQGMNVTILEAQNSILQRAVSPEIAQYIMALHQENGVNIITSSMAETLEGTDSVTGVRCASGTLIPAELVIIGIGVTPQTALAEQCKLATNNGISVNKYALTSDPNIVAAGDCTNYFHELYQRNVRLESIQNALEQSKSAAASIVDKNISFSRNVPRFWSDQYDIKLQICGLFDGYDEIEIEQDLEKRKLNALYFKKRTLVAAVAVNNPKLLMQAQAAIKAQISLNDEQIQQILMLPN